MILQQPRPYRIRLYERGAEVHLDRQYMAALDLTAGPGLREAEGKLDALLLSLAHADGARGERVSGYHLRVEDWHTGEFVCDWPARHWPE